MVVEGTKNLRGNGDQNGPQSNPILHDGTWVFGDFESQVTESGVGIHLIQSFECELLEYSRMFLRHTA